MLALAVGAGLFWLWIQVLKQWMRWRDVGLQEWQEPPGLHKLIANEEGISISSELKSSWLSWRTIAAVKAMPGGVSIQVGRSFIHIPNAEFPEDISPSAFVTFANTKIVEASRLSGPVLPRVVDAQSGAPRTRAARERFYSSRIRREPDSLQEQKREIDRILREPLLDAAASIATRHKTHSYFEEPLRLNLLLASGYTVDEVTDAAKRTSALLDFARSVVDAPPGERYELQDQMKILHPGFSESTYRQAMDRALFEAMW